MTGQYYLRSRYYNPVIARFTQEDTYYGDGLNLYIYCQNNPILNHDPTGHGTKENSPYSRKEQQYIDAGADPDTAKLETQCYPDAKSKQDLYNKYKSQGYNATDAKKLANYEIVHGEERAKNYAANNVKKSGPDYTPTSPRDNVNTDWRTQNRLNAQKKAGAGKSGTSSGRTFKSQYEIPTNEKGYTRSNLELGKIVHKEYMSDVADDVNKIKEYVLPSGKRVDFIDFENKIVYELKPNNPNQIRKGTKQLAGYLEEIETVFGKGWFSVLDTY